MRKFKVIAVLSVCLTALFLFPDHSFSQKEKKGSVKKRIVLSKEDLSGGDHHSSHLEIFGKYAKGYNKFVLRGIDKVQSTAPEGGSYFIGQKVTPPESPTGYEVKLFGHSLIHPARTSSYCSGSTYSAFIEAMNYIYEKDTLRKLSPERIEALRMQEPDGGRREDDIKFWGKWNADGFGNHFALLQYSHMGRIVKPEEAIPGDFMNISWKSGNGHSVIFLGWFSDSNNVRQVAYWSSQPGTDGFGDQVVPIERISEVMVIRLTNPENIFRFDVNKKTTNKVKGYKINW